MFLISQSVFRAENPTTFPSEDKRLKLTMPPCWRMSSVKPYTVTAAAPQLCRSARSRVTAYCARRKVCSATAAIPPGTRSSAANPCCRERIPAHYNIIRPRKWALSFLDLDKYRCPKPWKYLCCNVIKILMQILETIVASLEHYSVSHEMSSLVRKVRRCTILVSWEKLF